ncbi:MAG TPA: hypothetical protein PKK55_03015 [Methanofastidiosum sp.]|nr:hypothetical protein [Methanofastidiosum sp.]HOC78544.1 hypothetical protein [Methanofastidiosum sp.]HOG74069.1 hypothetical protein [Methanofastidiosum sp.]HQK63236.1 hypothetical protein [Methanofastidiosum sp.]HRZ19500.1 hypothetical protein [Methanofastidiosum sp.]
MDDEDKIILAGLGLFGAVAYMAIKELQERNPSDNQNNETKISTGDTRSQEELKKDKQVKKKSRIYKELLKLTLENKQK